MGDAFLEVMRKTGPERVELIGAQVTLGRASDNTVTFPEDDAVSRRHAVLIRAAGGWTLRDTGSSNGTYVNGERLVVDRVLNSGDRITLGNSRFTFRNDTATAAPVVERSPLPPRDHGREHGGGDVAGIVRDVQRRRLSDNHDELLFQVEGHDGTVSVQLSSVRSREVSDGDEVEIRGTWVAGTLRARTLFNVSTGAEITAGPRWEYVVLVSLGVLFLVLLLVIFAMTVGF